MMLNIGKSGGVDKIYFLQVAHFQHSIIEVLQFSEQLGNVCPVELQIRWWSNEFDAAGVTN